MPFSRREFLATSAATAASFTLLNSTSVFAAGVSDIRVATIGVRGRGENHLYGLADNIVAICDVDEEILGDDRHQPVGYGPSAPTQVHTFLQVSNGRPVRYCFDRRVSPEKCLLALSPRIVSR